jgi:predicted DNA-binding transcriptional regulator AlpA
MANPTDKPATDTPTDPLWLERIVSEAEAAKLRGVSPDTLKRAALRGEGPERLRLSPRRVGYRLREVLEK